MRVVMGSYAKRFLPQESSKPLMLGGVIIPDHEGLLDVTDGDVILQSLCQSLGSLGPYRHFLQLSTDLIEKDGITDSVVFLERSLPFLKGLKISGVCFCLEFKKPPLLDFFDKIQDNIARLLKIPKEHVALSINESSGLTDISCGDGIASVCTLSLETPVN